MATIKKIRHFVEYILLLGIGVIATALPRSYMLFLGARLGDLVFYCIPIRKQITVDNIARAFPEKSDREHRLIARGTYRNLGMVALEHLCMPSLSKDDLVRIIDMDNPEILDNALTRGKGVIFVGGHFGNWEYTGCGVGSAGYPMSFVVAEIANPYINKKVNIHRQEAGAQVIPKGVAIRGILRALKANGCVAMLMDQDAGAEGVFVDFFNQSCSAPEGPAVLALKTGASLLYFSAVRQPDHTIKVHFEEIDVDYGKGQSEENIKDITQRSTERLENSTREYPDHWFWMHRRWKSKPKATADLS